VGYNGEPFVQDREGPSHHPEVRGRSPSLEGEDGVAQDRGPSLEGEDAGSLRIRARALEGEDAASLRIRARASKDEVAYYAMIPQ
jgi:hypothetical protein